MCEILVIIFKELKCVYVYTHIAINIISNSIAFLFHLFISPSVKYHFPYVQNRCFGNRTCNTSLSDYSNMQLEIFVGLSPWLCHLVAVGPWECYLIALSLFLHLYNRNRSTYPKGLLKQNEGFKESSCCSQELFA